MKHLVKNILSSKARILTHMKIGSKEALNIVSSGRNAKIILNGYEIFSCNKNSKSMKKLADVTQNISVRLAERPASTKLVILKDPEDILVKELLEALVTGIEDIFEKDNMNIKNLPKDRADIQKTLNPKQNIAVSLDHSHIMNNLGVLSKKVSNVCKILDAAHQDALMLTRKKLVSTMWGAKAIKNILDEIREEMIQDAKWNKIDLYSEMICKSIRRLQSKLQTNLSEVCEEEQRIISEVLIPNIINNYGSLKELVIRAVYNLGILSNIDEIFKKHTSYPAAWFFDEVMLKGIQQEYDYLIKFICEIPKIEKCAIDPLDFARYRYQSE